MMMNYAVNDPLPAITVRELDKSQYRLKERTIQHIKIAHEAELHSTYEMKGKIGEGAFGVVLAIVERSTLKSWAMKTLCKMMAGWRLKLFQREIQILKLISHPHIIYLDRIYESPKKIYIVFEKCRRSLAKTLEMEKVLQEHVARKILKELIEAVAYLHKYDIVHRDIKLENILLGENPLDRTDEYYVKLTDFGLSIVKSGSGFDGMLQEYCGTMNYMSPEILTKKSYSQQCDMWAIGVMLYAMVIGHYPFAAKDQKSLIQQIRFNDPVFKNTQLSNDAIDLIRLLLMKNPANRITAQEVLNHMWVVNQKTNVKIVQTSNILQMMKEWKSEMTVPSGQESDWAVGQNEFLKKQETTNKQPLPLPVTDIKFENNSRLSFLSERARANSSSTRQISPDAYKPLIVREYQKTKKPPQILKTLAETASQKTSKPKD